MRRSISLSSARTASGLVLMLACEEGERGLPSHKPPNRNTTSARLCVCVRCARLVDPSSCCVALESLKWIIGASKRARVGAWLGRPRVGPTPSPSFVHASCPAFLVQSRIIKSLDGKPGLAKPEPDHQAIALAVARSSSSDV